MVLRELNPSEVYYLLIHKRTVFWTIKILASCQAKGVLENSNYLFCLFVCLMSSSYTGWYQTFEP